MKPKIPNCLYSNMVFLRYLLPGETASILNQRKYSSFDVDFKIFRNFLIDSVPKIRYI